jgi:hypothetical protein
MMLIVFLVGAAFCYFGLKLVFNMGKRRFERTNIAGVQEFKDYGSVVKNRAKDALSRLFGIGFTTVGALMVMVALVQCSK